MLSLSAAELTCLALTVYFEARNQPIEGQAAVAHVVLNRVDDPRWPNTICEVVHEGGEKPRHRCQFSWYCDGHPDTPFNWRAYRRARVVAQLAINGAYPDVSQGATHYHSRSVQPTWSLSIDITKSVGDHIFYIEGPRR